MPKPGFMPYRPEREFRWCERHKKLYSLIEGCTLCRLLQVGRK